MDHFRIRKSHSIIIPRKRGIQNYMKIKNKCLVHLLKYFQYVILPHVRTCNRQQFWNTSYQASLCYHCIVQKRDYTIVKNMFAGVDKSDLLDYIVAENPNSDFLDHTVNENTHGENPMNSASNWTLSFWLPSTKLSTEVH